MSVFLRLESFQGILSSSEQKIYDLIVAHPDQVIKMTAKEIATASGVSAPTVVRFSKKVGYQSLTDFKIQLSTELQTNKLQPANYNDVAPNDSFYSIKEKISANTQVSLNETTNLLTEATLNEAIALLEDAEVMFTFGIGASALTAQDIQHKWSRLGKIVCQEQDIHLLLPQLINQKKRALLFLISNSGQTPEIVYLAKVAKEIGIPIITLTQFGPNPLNEQATIGLQTARPTEAINRSAATTSLLSQFLVIDMLFYTFISQFPHYQEAVTTSRTLIKSYNEWRH